MTSLNKPGDAIVITNALGELRAFKKFLKTSVKTCASCARGARFGVVYESAGSLTVECEQCGNTEYMPPLPENLFDGQ